MRCFEGTPRELGRAYGEEGREGIIANLRVLVRREELEPLPHADPAFQAWVDGQRSLIEQHWPWLLEEMAGVAEAVGAGADEVLLLNLRAWQYDHYGRPPAGGCSSFAVALADGNMACAGALDDPVEYYCGAVRFAPANGLRHLTFPLTGASWGNRGMNAAGLVVGISSQLLPDLRRLPHAVNQDLAVRVILSECATVGEVREFCRRHPFTMNLLCADAEGGILCAHQTAAGLYELPVEGRFGVLTNHVADDGIRRRLSDHGVTAFPESPTTRARRGRLLEFCRARAGACDLDEVLREVGRRDDADPGTIHNEGTIALTCAAPQAEPGALWVAEPQGAAEDREFRRLTV